ncbi:hypothetical protein GCM10029992_09650 [Glycomyces albus]
MWLERKGFSVDHGSMVGTGVREAIVGDRRITGLTPEVIAAIAAEIGPQWEQERVDRLVSRPRTRAIGAGAQHRLVFIDRLLATLVNLRHAVTHDVLACWFGVDRSTVTRAIAEIRPCWPLGAARSLPASGCAPSPRSSTISASPGRSASSTAPRSASADPPRALRTGTGSSPARPSRTR